MSSRYNDYSVKDFDQYDCLKISKRFYLVLIFILRAYIVWIISVTNMRDRVGIMQWLYPETHLFFLSLISGSIGLFAVFIIALRRPNAALWLQIAWRNFRTILLIALLFDFLINIIAFYYWQLLSQSWLLVQGTVVAILIILCFTSKRINLNLTEFPKEMPK